MERQLQRRLMPAEILDDQLIPGLPNEMGILCIARVPRADYTTLKCVCRHWRNLLRRREFADIRRKHSLAEEWLYMWTQTATQERWRCVDPSSQRWQMLPAMPNDGRISGHSAFGSLDGKVFVVGGVHSAVNTHAGLQLAASRFVSYFDTSLYAWRRAADLQYPQARCMVASLNEQLYVFGGYRDGVGNLSVKGEVYNLLMNTWSTISDMPNAIEMCDCTVFGGKIYALGTTNGSGIVYDPVTNTWEVMQDRVSRGWEAIATVLEGVLYSVGDDFWAGRDLHYQDPNGRRVSPLYPDNYIQFYNTDEEDWNDVDDFWDESEVNFTVLMRNVELVTLKESQALCTVSAETVEPATGVKTVWIVISDPVSDVDRTTLHHRVIYRHGVDQHEIAAPREIRSCQVISL